MSRFVLSVEEQLILPVEARSLLDAVRVIATEEPRSMFLCERVYHAPHHCYIVGRNSPLNPGKSFRVTVRGTQGLVGFRPDSRYGDFTVTVATTVVNDPALRRKVRQQAYATVESVSGQLVDMLDGGYQPAEAVCDRCFKPVYTDTLYSSYICPDEDHGRIPFERVHFVDHVSV